jgi:predicted lipid-binding transport protein (Tim44 family)
MADGKPSFKTLFEQYIEAWNAHSLSEIGELLSPHVEVYFKGKQIADEYGEAMKKYYTDHWALSNSTITIKKVEEKPEENAVEVQMVDHAKEKLVSSKYIWAEIDGKWLQVKHEINDVVEAA